MHCKGYSVFKSTHEPWSNLTNCPAFLCAFLQCYGWCSSRKGEVMLSFVDLSLDLITFFVLLKVILCVKIFYYSLVYLAIIMHFVFFIWICMYKVMVFWSFGGLSTVFQGLNWVVCDVQHISGCAWLLQALDAST